MKMLEGEMSQQQKGVEYSTILIPGYALRHSVAKSRALPAHLGAIEMEST